MSGPFGSSQWMYSSGGFYDFPIEQSLKFNYDDSDYLSWTPTSAGNRKTWTWSCWVKRTKLGLASSIFSVNFGSNDTDYFDIRFYGDNTLRFGTWNISLSDHSRVYRDVSSWYHIVLAIDTTQATSTNRARLYINGVQQTAVTGSGLTLNQDTAINSANSHRIGFGEAVAAYANMYLAEVNFIDGQALDATSFGEFKSGVWIPKDPSGLTYGTNGFRLSFQNDTVSEGFNAVTYRGTGGPQSVSGIGFTPDFLWFKNRSSATEHGLHDSVRGVRYLLNSDTTGAELDRPTYVSSIDADGFSFGDNVSNYNAGGNSYVAWCWDAGSGSPVSNTDGSITSTVKANTAYGFSIVSYTGTGSAATVGHGLSSAPEMIIVKSRTQAQNWAVYHSALGNSRAMFLNLTNAQSSLSNAYWNSASPTSSVFSINTALQTNVASGGMIAYAFHSVTGYSKVGSYTGTGANGNAISLGWKPAFVLVKKSSNTGNWVMLDGNRFSSTNQYHLNADLSDGEYTDMVVQFTDTGFTVGSTGGINHSGETFVYLAIKDTRDNAFWRDQSGNGNDWQPNNLTYQDSLPDSTTNNFCTFNSAIRPYPNSDVLSEGNLRRTNSATGVTGSNWGTFNVTSGKWYYETAIETSGALTCWIGWSNNEIFAAGGTYASAARDHAYMYMSNGNKALDSATGTSYGATYNTGDVIGVALDADNNTLTFYKNGVSQGVAFTGISTVGSWIPAVSSDPGWIPVVNFGQDSSFAGNKPVQGNTDENGYGDFYYAPPSGYLALCTANLPDPVIDPAQDDVPSDYMNVVTYTGDGASTMNVTVGWQPDLFWVKSRGQAQPPFMVDAIRTGDRKLRTDRTDAENTGQGFSFTSTGWSRSFLDPETNTNGDGYVSWNWLAGNGTSSNTDGSITSTVSVNQKAGFSVIGYTGTGANASIGHGLGQKPKLAFFKNRDTTSDWRVYYDINGLGAGVRYLTLNSTAASVYDPNIWQNGPASDTVINIGSAGEVNGSGGRIICYAFAEVEGYSKFGSFGFNNSTDGPFVFCGFRPAFVLYKEISGTNNWEIIDATRNPYNVGNARLFPSSSSAESTAENSMDLVSNGFKVRDNYGGLNLNSDHIFMAFAETPFKYANAR